MLPPLEVVVLPQGVRCLVCRRCIGDELVHWQLIPQGELAFMESGAQRDEQSVFHSNGRDVLGCRVVKWHCVRQGPRTHSSRLPIP